MGIDHTRHALMSAALWALLVAPAAAKPSAYPDYPTDRGQASVDAWVATETDLDPASIVGVGEDALFAVETATGVGSGAPYRRVAVRQEALNAAFARRLGGRSLVMVVDIDCTTSRIFQRGLDLYRGNNRQGAAQPLGGGADWEAAAPDTAMGNAVKAVCSGALPRPPRSSTETR